MSELFARDTQRRPRFFVIDGWGAAPLLGFIVHLSWWTLFLVIVTWTILVLLERRNYTIPQAYRATKAWFLPSYRPTRPRRLLRRMR
jgi:hypothetical protein